MARRGRFFFRGMRRGNPAGRGRRKWEKRKKKEEGGRGLMEIGVSPPKKRKK